MDQRDDEPTVNKLILTGGLGPVKLVMPAEDCSQVEFFIE
jgi:hypothetical protein